MPWPVPPDLRETALVKEQVDLDRTGPLTTSSPAMEIKNEPSVIARALHEGVRPRKYVATKAQVEPRRSRPKGNDEGDNETASCAVRLILIPSYK